MSILNFRLLRGPTVQYDGGYLPIWAKRLASDTRSPGSADPDLDGRLTAFTA